MTDDALQEAFQNACSKWGEAIKRKDFHDAISTGISVYLIAREKGNEQIANGSLGLIHVAIGALLKAEIPNSAGPSCSFCGRSQSEARLGAGPNAYICAECVASLHEILNPPPKS